MPPPLGISLPRYYVLETRVIQGIINACEPLPRGRQRTAEDKIADLKRVNERLRHEVSRMQAVVRAAQRSIGLPSTPPATKAKSGNGKAAKAKRKRKKTPRAQKMIAVLRKPDDAEATASDKIGTKDCHSAAEKVHTVNQPPSH